MIEGPLKPKEESADNKTEDILSPEERSEWIRGMKEYAEQLVEAIARLKGELENIEDGSKQQEVEELILELKDQLEGTKENIELGNNTDKDVRRIE